MDSEDEVTQNTMHFSKKQLNFLLVIDINVHKLKWEHVYVQLWDVVILQLGL